MSSIRLHQKFYSTVERTAKMRRALVESLASSSAHGISRAVSVRSRQLKVIWLLLFLAFTALFCKDALELVGKLINASIVTTSEVDSVPFEFPDLFACPRHPISGSIPYALSESEAATANEEIFRLELLYERLKDEKGEPKYLILETRSRIILNSLPTELLNKIILSRSQSIIMKSNNSGVDNETALFSEMKVLCFKIPAKNMGRSGLPPELIKLDTLELELFTDPYDSHFNYTGSPIREIMDLRNTSRRAPVSHWDLEKGLRDPVSDSGFSLLLVPRGTYPSVLIEPSVSLAPGHSYDISLSMEQVTYSEELQRKSCTIKEPKLQFVDLLNGGMLEYEYSYAGCLIDRLSRKKEKDSGGYVWPSYQVPWDLRDSLRWETLPDILVEMGRSPAEFFGNPNELPNCQQPCQRLRYKASISATNWPTFNRNYSHGFWNVSAGKQPALAQLANMAKQLALDNHSSHLEATFRSRVANSMLRIKISADSPMSTRLVIAKSYSTTAFLADVGGVLGLYIGCSLLTVCEVIELIYHLVASIVGSRPGPKQQEEIKEADAADVYTLEEKNDIPNTVTENC
ncbi:hypothetical protein BOX15_Mlig003674g1 [Macrostomum lignano]|uniref:Uncharacterized protein n=2 Tax=Macrostomum lignano TaxID=282301 RepID=A0A267EAV9_9PLAT|nr:hypothetical protein BOX15_Mlig003674g1 [Macrostomum lignano]